MFTRLAMDKCTDVTDRWGKQTGRKHYASSQSRLVKP